MKLDASGTFSWFITYIGGSGKDSALAIALDANPAVYITGITQSNDFPTKNAVQPSFGGGGADAFVVKLNLSGNDLAYSTYLGGSDYDVGNGIAAHPLGGQAFVAGSTQSSTIPSSSSVVCGRP